MLELMGVEGYMDGPEQQGSCFIVFVTLVLFGDKLPSRRALEMDESPEASRIGPSNKGPSNLGLFCLLKSKTY